MPGISTRSYPEWSYRCFARRAHQNVEQLLRDRHNRFLGRIGTVTKRWTTVDSLQLKVERTSPRLRFAGRYRSAGEGSTFGYFGRSSLISEAPAARLRELWRNVPWLAWNVRGQFVVTFIVMRGSGAVGVCGEIMELAALWAIGLA